MWKMIYESAAGTSHTRDGRPCQDYCLGQSFDGPCGPALIVACSDGAGSAEHSALGAKIACEIVVDRAWESLRNSDAPDEVVSRDSFLVWFDAARRVIRDEATLLGVAPRDLACTMLVAIVGESWAAFAQVGDGAMVRGGPDACRVVFWPESGEYANTTTFLTDDHYADRIRFSRQDEPIDEIAVFTDGLQMLALDYSSREAHAPFFRPMFGALRGCESTNALKGPLRTFLDSERVNERTDDDKTLFLATRVRPATDPPTPPADEPG